MTSRRSKIVLPIAFFALAALGAWWLVATRPAAVPVPRPERTPLVRVQRIEPQVYEFVVVAHGTVVPRREGDLVPQVSGPVVWVSPALASGGFFAAGEPLVRIDRADYDVALETARAAVARAGSEHDRATKELERQKRLAASSVASETLYDDAANRERVTAAALRESRARLDLAERDLARTEISAPYAGRVRQADVDVGEFVSKGAPIGRIYAVDFAEVRLPVPDLELGFLDLPLQGLGDAEALPGPIARLRAHFAGREHEWRGRVVRTEGEIDARSRMVQLIVRVADPYFRQAGADATGERMPLAVGLFVEAELVGRQLEEVVLLPRAALRDDHEVLLVDAELKLRRRAVDVLRFESEQVVIGAGLVAGERVVISPIRAVVDGMQVRVVEDEPDEHLGGAGGAAGDRS